MKAGRIRNAALVLALAALLALSACGAAEPSAKEPSAETQTRAFTDSLGREAELPEQLNRVALSGPAAQIVLFALCPDKLVGIAEPWSAEAGQYLDEKYLEMPVIGHLYGGRTEFDLETLLRSGAQVVVDVGQPKEGIREDLDALQEQTGIPFVHVSAYTEAMGDTYRKLGELLNMPDEAEKLAAYCEAAYERALGIAQSAEKAGLLYITGDKGLNVIARGSYHAELIDLLADNLAVVDEPSGKGTGNEVDVEQLLKWDPDVLLIAPDSVYGSIGSDPLLQEISAVKTGRYYEVPQGPYNWMGFPPSVQRILGMLWMAKLLYPDAADYDLCEEVTEYYKLFYHCELTPEQYGALVANSIGK